MSNDNPREPRHPIRVVAQRTALSTEVLRAWERRYNVVTPGRTETGQRLYSDADIERLRLLRQATQHGRSISHIAELTTEELERLVREDEAERIRKAELSRSVEVRPSLTAPHLRAAEAAVRALDAPRLEAVLMRAMVTLSADVFLEEIAIPLLRFLGSRWAEGDLGVAHEHMASAILRRVLGFMADTSETPVEAPLVICATPARQVHEFGALLAAAAAASAAWRVIYLGADLPARDIAQAAVQAGARAVALSVVFANGDAQLAEELRKVREAVPVGTELLVGGAGAAEFEELLEGIGAWHIDDLPGFRASLHEIAAGDAAAPPGSNGAVAPRRGEAAAR